VDRRSTQPVLANVLFQVKDNVVLITCSDLETEISTNIEFDEIQADGNTTVSAKKLIDICKSLPSDTLLEVFVDKGKFFIKSKSSNFSLSTIDYSNFTKFDLSSPVKLLSILGSDFSKALSSTVFAAASQDVRHYLNGLLLEIKDNKIRLVATDGHRLSFYENDTDTDIIKTAIIPKKAVLELTKILNEYPKKIDVYAQDKFLLFRTNKSKIITKLIDGIYPNYTRAMPAKSNIFAKIPTLEFKMSLQRANILASEKHRGVNVLFKKNSLEVSARNTDQEVATDEININYNGPELTIGFNSSYLLEVLNHIKTDEFIFYANSPTSSVLLKESDENSLYSFVVMPMRI
jgi:DNA polymerase-3 subunit beta